MKVLLLLLSLAGSAHAGALDLFSTQTRQYVTDRVKEARAGYTMSFDGTSGGSLYLPVRYLSSRLLEAGVGYHLQEGGQDKPFVFLGADIQALYRATLKRWFGLGVLQGPPLPPLYLSAWANAPTGQTWVVGRETGVQVSVELLP